jgi:hypothetical protein
VFENCQGPEAAGIVAVEGREEEPMLRSTARKDKIAEKIKLGFWVFW